MPNITNSYLEAGGIFCTFSSMENRKEYQPIAFGVVFGMIAGIILGTARGNLGLWIGPGIAIGASIGAHWQKKYGQDESQ